MAMKAWLLDNFSGIDSLRLAEIPDPKPGAGEVLLELVLAAQNPADRYLAEGQYPAKPPLPHVLGRDGVGIARDFGTEVTGIVRMARGENCRARVWCHDALHRGRRAS